MAPLSQTEITDGGKERVRKSSHVMTEIFQDDPVYNWLLYTTPSSKHKAHLLALIHGIMKATVISHGCITEVGDWSASAAFCPPGQSPDGLFTVLQAGIIPVMVKLGLSPCKRVLVEYTSAVKKAKAKGLTRKDMNEGYWYVVIMGTKLQRRKQGLAGRLLEDLKLKALDGGYPIWLEATTPESKQLYEKHGFKTIEDINLGKGKVGTDGQAKLGGEGITIWGMVWRPEKSEGHHEQSFI